MATKILMRVPRTSVSNGYCGNGQFSRNDNHSMAHDTRFSLTLDTIPERQPRKFHIRVCLRQVAYHLPSLTSVDGTRRFQRQPGRKTVKHLPDTHCVRERKRCKFSKRRSVNATDTPARVDIAAHIDVTLLLQAAESSTRRECAFRTS